MIHSKRIQVISGHLTPFRLRHKTSIELTHNISSEKRLHFSGGGGFTRKGRKRICFQMKFDTSNISQYLKDHETVWPELQKALVDCGWHDYSLFYRDDGYAIGYYETEHKNHQEACDLMGKLDINARWQDTMSKYTAQNVRPDEASMSLNHFFYLGNDRVFEKLANNSNSEDDVWNVQKYTGGGNLTKAGWKRICFQMKINPNKLSECIKEHEALCSKLQEALILSGWHNYSLFSRPDGLIIGYYETENKNHQESCDRLAKFNIYNRWYTAMLKYKAKNTKSNYSTITLEHYFYLGIDTK